MVVALASTVVIARKSNARKIPVRVMVGLVNVCFILNNNVEIIIIINKIIII